MRSARTCKNYIKNELDFCVKDIEKVRNHVNRLYTY